MIKQKIREQPASTADEPAPITLSVTPAIDAIVAEVAGRELVSGAEIVDRLLDLRLIAVAAEMFANAH